ncbi:hypothetical protein DICPUDRAFT_77535 [Dictyostelium purpureum]|uniref:Transmembrane protein n=1 Tax=Dictyostelium purpureum TaxID=5786 RepID=F0ZGW7_DICPU|nr:uncharacterized protein DICPUDRAFT_77535 [Dictyostelium purpureum]EGC36804.1 hypothetical protein DICPUDRAFT_77535 [Dictyostelium purpureum]|eukprot:XP_003286675.1 hypothetical protein DICPUDRAFT_77535 [Dictyostelium purpureum]
MSQVELDQFQDLENKNEDQFLQEQTPNQQTTFNLNELNSFSPPINPERENNDSDYPSSSIANNNNNANNFNNTNNFNNILNLNILNNYNNSTSNNNNNNNNKNLVMDSNESLNSALHHSNISSSAPYNEFSTKNSVDEIVFFSKPPSLQSLAFRIVSSWVFGLVNMVILMLFNPSHPMQFIWGVLCIGCCMTAIFAISWSSLLLKFPISFLIIFATTIYWVGTPITWEILYVINLYPPPIGVFTCIFPFEGLSLVLVCLLIPRAIRNKNGFRKKVITAFSSLVAPYLSFVSGLIYFRLFQYSNNIGRILLPPVYTVVMKIIQIGLDIICIRCAHSGSNLLIIIGRIIASYYSFAVLSFVRNPVSLISVILSKFGLHIFMSIFMVYPSIENKIISLLPKSIIDWKVSFEKGNLDKEAASFESNLDPHNEFDRMALENDPVYFKIHSKGTNLWFSQFSDLLAILMALTVYTMGRYGPTSAHYNNMFPFNNDTSKVMGLNDHFHLFLIYLTICFVALIIIYSSMWFALNKIIKTLELKKIAALVSVNWFPLNHFYVSCINFMMAYVIVVVALMPDLFYIPGIDFWNTSN